MRRTCLAIVIALIGLCISDRAFAGILAKAQLVTPLAPEMPTHLSIPMPTNVDPAQPLWVSYRVLAMSASSTPTGEIVLDGSFEGVQTPIQHSVVQFSPDEMTVATSGGTIAQQFEANYGQRTPQELQTTFGAELYQAYEAVNAGTGRILDGIAVKTLPALGKNEGMLLVSVERASGIRPVGVFVVVGQGDIPAEFKKSPASGGDVSSSSAYRLGRTFGILIFIGLLYWLFIGRHKRR